MKKKFLSVLSLGIIGGYSLITYAHTVPGWDEPCDIDAYYSQTEISWADSPSPFALKDLASNGGNVYDYTRHLKSIIFGEKFVKTAETAESITKNEKINSTPFSEEIFSETADALKIIGIGIEKISKTVDISEKNKNLCQGNSDDWESYDQNFYSHEEKLKFLSETYRNFADGAKTELDETEKSIKAAKKIFSHTNLSEGILQTEQARNELKTLLAYELARENALETNLAQMQAVFQAAEYDSNVESAYIDSITKFDVADPYDEVNYKILREEYEYTKPKVPSMPNFK